MDVDFLVQEFIKESSGMDIRAFVVGDQVVASMKRVAKSGEFRANLHQGGKAEKVELSQQEQEVSIRATRALGLTVAGVDILRSTRGPLILEVNSSPGLEGIETTTGILVAEKIIEHMEKSYQAQISIGHNKSQQG
jgi:ribosomal protein S6--L-glutamate ligase